MSFSEWLEKIFCMSVAEYYGILGSDDQEEIRQRYLNWLSSH